MPPLRLDIDGSALAANWRWIARRANTECGAAVKANGYGLGAREVVNCLAQAGARHFFVSNWDEATALRGLSNDVAVSVLHGVREEDMAAALGGPARPVLNSAAQVARWRAAGGGACDVMVDTGINRLGLFPADACSGLLDGLPIDTLMSHLACADDAGSPMNVRQLAAFTAVRERVSAVRYSLANSAGVMLGADYAGDLVRPGLALYGGQPAPGMAAIRSVVTPTAEVIQLRRVEAGEPVGYGATWIAPCTSTIAILNIGYADGYFRGFAGWGTARVDDRTCPLVGLISMDLVAADVTGLDVAEGDWLALAHDLPAAAAWTGLSQYELLTGLGSRYQRRWT